MFPPGYFSPLHFPSPSIIIHSCKDEVSHVSLCGCVWVAQSCPTLWTPQTVAHQVSLSTEFSRQEYWSGLQFPSPEELPNPGIELWFPAWQADSLPFELQGSLSVDSVSLWEFSSQSCRFTVAFFLKGVPKGHEVDNVAILELLNSRNNTSNKLSKIVF